MLAFIAGAAREDRGGIVGPTGDLLLLLDERDPIDGLVVQNLVRDLLVVHEIDAQRRDRLRLAVELTRSPLHLVDDTPNPDNRCGCRREQQHQHDGERSGPLTSQTPPEPWPIDHDSSADEAWRGSQSSYAGCCSGGSRGTQSTDRSCSVDLSAGVGARDTPRCKVLAVPPK